MITFDEVYRFALEHGYDNVSKDAPWRGYDVYTPGFDCEPGKYVCVGPPLVILVKGSKIRMSTAAEAYEIIGL